MSETAPAEKFQEAMKKILAVSKTEIERREAEYQAERKRKKRKDK